MSFSSRLSVWLIPDLHAQPFLITRRDTRHTVALHVPDTQSSPHEDIRIQDIIGCDLGALATAQGMREGRPYALEERVRGLLEYAQALLTPSHSLFALLHRMASKGPKGQLWMCLIDPLL